jgi:hypothetical protein
MNGFYGDLTPSRGSEVVLTPENEEMAKSLLEGISSALRSDFVDIYEVVDTDHENSLFKLPKERYLAKVLFMKLALADIDSESLTESDPDFQVAIVARAHGLSTDDALEQLHSSENTSFVWPDNIQTYLLDNTYNNLSHWGFTFQKQPRLSDFHFTGSQGGFTRRSQSNKGLIDQAYAINSVGPGVSIDEHGLTSMGELRILETTLKKGRLDKVAAETLRIATESSSEINYMSDNFEVVRGSVPYFNKLSDEALQFSPDFRKMVAWQQHLDTL